MRKLPLALVLVAATVLPGCLGGLFGNRPDWSVQRSDWDAGAWERDGTFEVTVVEPEAHEVRITATGADGTRRTATGASSSDLPPVQLDLADGTWTVRYTIDGHKWETIRNVRIDTQAPVIAGLPTVVDAPDGSVTLGQGATITGASRVSVTAQATGAAIATGLPVPLSGLPDGVHAYDVEAEDAAGNVARITVQVRVGDALELPAGQFTFGIVARYTQDLQMWDLTDLDAYLSREQARAAAAQLASGGYLGSGVGITPADAAVQDVVADVVRPDDNSIEAALHLFQWMADELDYQESRLDQTGLLQPSETLAADGGVCRDLAALYVSLLRGAGVPARLVAGYLAGQVGGFHAWVEVYVGAVGGQGPWMPVDVSPIDGAYDTATLMQAFGIHLPSHLPLRALTEAQEDQEWHQAVSISYSYPDRPGPDDEPEVEAADVLDTVFETKRYLCFTDGLERRISTRHDGTCFSDFVIAAELVIDYGVDVQRSVRGSEVTGDLAYPVPGTPAEMVFYGASFHSDPATGMTTATKTYA